MANQNEKKIGTWFGDITNLAALLAIAIVAFELFQFKDKDKLVLLIALGALILMVLLRYADVGRFKQPISSQEAIPPLGLARGSVRAFLAFGALLGVGLYVYYVTVNVSGEEEKVFKPQVFTALSAIISAVVGFYFGAKTAAVAQAAVRPFPPTVSSIGPSEGAAGKTDFETTVTGTGFQADATVTLALGAHSVPAKRVEVVHTNRITCTFDLPSQTGKWDVVVANPDGQMGTLPEGFEVKLAEVAVPAEPTTPAESTTPEPGGGA